MSDDYQIRDARKWLERAEEPGTSETRRAACFEHCIDVLRDLEGVYAEERMERIADAMDQEAARVFTPTVRRVM